jgi:hypothetical protein
MVSYTLDQFGVLSLREPRSFRLSIPLRYSEINGGKVAAGVMQFLVVKLVCISFGLDESDKAGTSLEKFVIKRPSRINCKGTVLGIDNRPR